MIDFYLEKKRIQKGRRLFWYCWKSNRLKAGLFWHFSLRSCCSLCPTISSPRSFPAWVLSSCSLTSIPCPQRGQLCPPMVSEWSPFHLHLYLVTIILFMLLVVLLSETSSYKHYLLLFTCKSSLGSIRRWVLWGENYSLSVLVLYPQSAARSGLQKAWLEVKSH